MCSCAKKGLTAQLTLSRWLCHGYSVENMGILILGMLIWDFNWPPPRLPRWYFAGPFPPQVVIHLWTSPSEARDLYIWTLPCIPRMFPRFFFRLWRWELTKTQRLQPTPRSEQMMLDLCVFDLWAFCGFLEAKFGGKERGKSSRSVFSLCARFFLLSSVSRLLGCSVALWEILGEVAHLWWKKVLTSGLSEKRRKPLDYFVCLCWFLAFLTSNMLELKSFCAFLTCCDVFLWMQRPSGRAAIICHVCSVGSCPWFRRVFTRIRMVRIFKESCFTRFAK